jgi:uncharacterized protein (DUF4415 family)
MPKQIDSKRKKREAPANSPDGQIDLSDIPEIQSFPPSAMIGRFYRPKKTPVTIRLDADVLEWLKQSGEGYQTRINDYLRQIMVSNAGSSR